MMQLLKPAWVTHDGRPIFSVDIHPDASRFATGGQGDETGSGKVIIWNMAPIRSEDDEADETVPKILCQMDNHIACVNCVRWSSNGMYLASCGDDKVVIIWQTSRYQSAPAPCFGSTKKAANIEQWRPVSTLRGHTGDILDLSWSPNDIWIATSSVDNTVIIWNAQKFPEQVKVLRGHTGLVKGVTWDPVGKYVATQSDDKTLRIWRTRDWQTDEIIKEPFKECGGTTHVLRLSWSPDGHYIVSAHAMNNSGPTAQIIERDGWRAMLDFVGHRKAVTVVRFNPNILSKKIQKDSDKLQQYSCCAIGSRDHSISIWLTALKRPLVVTNDLFTNSVLDISWSRDGMELLCCSSDGTLAYVGFQKEEIGTPLMDQEVQMILEKTYGKNLAFSSKGKANAQLVESAELLDLQREQKVLEQKQMESPVKNVITNGEDFKPIDKQIETRTPDGRRRITPIFIAPQPAFGDAPLPFDSKRVLSSSTTEASKIVVEKVVGTQDSMSAMTSSVTPTSSPQAVKSTTDTTPKSNDSTKKSEPVTETISTYQPMAALLQKPPKQPELTSQDESEEEEDKDIHEDDDKSTPKEDKFKEIRNKLSVKRKLNDDRMKSKLIKPKKPKENGLTPKSVSYPTTPVVIEERLECPVPSATPAPVATPRYTLPVAEISKVQTRQIYGEDNSNHLMLDVENDLKVGSVTIHKVQCYKQGEVIWEQALPSKVISVAGAKEIACVACEDQSLCIYSANGRKIFPNMVLNAKVSTLQCEDDHVMAVTQDGSVFVWNAKTQSTVIKNESLFSIMQGSSIHSTTLTKEGQPIISLSNGKSFTYSTNLGCWVVVCNRLDPLEKCSQHRQFTPKDPSLQPHGILQSLYSSNDRILGSSMGKMLRGGGTLQSTSTIAYVESNLVTSVTMKSPQEYKFWLHTYVRCLVEEGLELKLREICDDLLGPVYSSKSSSWSNTILGLNKRELLKEILPLFGQSLKLQRLYSEYQGQLECVVK